MRRVIMAEALLVLLLAGVMLLLLYRKPPRTDAGEQEVKDMFETIAEGVSVAPGDALRIRRIFGLEASDYELAVYYTPVETMDVCEFFLVRGSDAAQDAAVKAMEERLASQKAAFDGYGEHQCELLDKAVIWQDGSYACLIVSETPQEWLAAVKELLEVREAGFYLGGVLWYSAA